MEYPLSACSSTRIKIMTINIVSIQINAVLIQRVESVDNLDTTDFEASLCQFERLSQLEIYSIIFPFINSLYSLQFKLSLP